MYPSASPQHHNTDRDEAALRLVEGLLRNKQRPMNIKDSLLLDEVELCSTKLSAKTRADYRRLQEHFVAFLEGHGADLATAERKHVQFFVAHLAERSALTERLAERCSHCQAAGRSGGGYSPSYVKRHLAAIKAAYDHLVEEKVAVLDPSYGVRRPTVTVTAQYVPTVEEVRALMDYRGTPLSRVVVRWAYYEPARRAELVSPRWSDIDEFARWHLVAKGAKAHSYALHPEVLRALRAYREYQQRQASRYPAMARALADPQTAYVFLTRTGKAMSGGQFVRVLKRHAVRAGIALIPAAGKQWDAVDGMTSRLGPHALRRAWARHALNDPDNPVPLDVVSLVLGHADVTTTRRFYAETDDGRGADALRNRRL